MHCLDRTLASVSLAFVLAGCSDDGLAPPADTDASTGVVASSTAGSEGPTGDTLEPGTGTGTGGPTDDSTTGGDTGTTGTDETGGTTTGEPPMVCENAMQCLLVDDCCECAAYHMDDTPPECPMECDQPMCAALGIPDIGVVCEAGMCELEPRDCSGIVVCDSLPPACPEGTLPEVGPGGGGCWTGACIPVDACDPLPSCDYCDETEACVAVDTQQGTFYSCRAIPEECMGVATCECMPPETCEAPFDTCVDMDGQISCTCPAC